MPACNVIPLRKKIHAAILQEEQNLSYREIAKIIQIPKSTLFDNMVSFKSESDKFLNFLNYDDLRFAEDTLNFMFNGKTSARDAAKILSHQRSGHIPHQRVLNVLDKLALHAEEKNKIDLNNNSQKIPCMAFDEVFQKKSPLLGGLDPHSGFGYFQTYADRSKESWEKYLNELGVNCIYSVSDGGLGFLAAVTENRENVIRIRDFFHLLQKLSKALTKLEGLCYSLLSKVYKTKSKDQDLTEIIKKTDTLIAIYDQLNAAIKQFRQSFYMENPDGEYIDSAAQKEQITQVVNLLDQAIAAGATHRNIYEAKSYLSNSPDEIVAHKKILEQLVKEEFGEIHQNMVLGYICPIIECLDQISRSYENTKRTLYWQSKLVEHKQRFNISFVNQEEINAAINKAARLMITVKKSNSLIETANSVIRRFLTSYRSIPRWFCPIFTYYWNHRRFARGKRHGLTPLEILDGTPGAVEMDWINELLEDWQPKIEPEQYSVTEYEEELLQTA
jgi:hypothetical protein